MGSREGGRGRGERKKEEVRREKIKKKSYSENFVNAKFGQIDLYCKRGFQPTNPSCFYIQVLKYL